MRHARTVRARWTVCPDLTQACACGQSVAVGHTSSGRDARTTHRPPAEEQRVHARCEVGLWTFRVDVGPSPSTPHAAHDSVSRCERVEHGPRHCLWQLTASASVLGCGSAASAWLRSGT